MAITIASMVAKVSADTGDAESKLSGFSKHFVNASSLAAAAGLAIAAVAVGVAVQSTRMAADFQTGMNTLVTGAGESAKNLGMVSNGILDLAVSTGTTTKQLTDGMFMIESAGFHGAAGLDVLKAAAEGAKVGNADLGTVANAVTTEMVDYAASHINAAKATNILIATVANGKTTMEQLAGAMSTILPTASAARIGLIDIQGAMATLTGEGVDAANAATYLRQLIVALQAPSKQTASALQGIGLNARDVANEMKVSLPGAIQLITDHLKKKFPEGSAAYVAALKDIAGGSKQMQGLLDLTGTHLQTFKDNVTSITGAVKAGGNGINGWARVQESFNLKMDRAKEVVETLMIRLGTGLLPIAGDIADLVGTKLVPAFTNFISFLQKGGPAADLVKVGLFALAGVVGGLLVMSFVAAAAAAWAFVAPLLVAAAPFIAIGAAIGAVVGIIVLLVTHWKQITSFLQGVWNGAVHQVQNGLHSLGDALGSVGRFFQSTWQGIQSATHTAITAVANFLQAGFHLIIDIVTAPIRGIVALFEWLFNHNYFFHDLVESIVSEFTRAKTFITDVWNGIKAFLAAAWLLIQTGAKIAWSLIQQHILNPIEVTWARIQAVWNTVVGFLGSIWSDITGAAKRAWDNFVGQITGAVGSAGKAAGDVLGGIRDALGNLAGEALQWGQNMIKGFIQGIENMAGDAKNAAGNVIGGIGKMLGFHSPTEEGPGATADQWGPNLIGMFAQGMRSKIAEVRSAALAVAAAASPAVTGAGVSVSAAFSAAGASAASSAPSLTTSPLVAASGATSAGQGGGTMHVILQLDSRTIAEKTMPYVAGTVRMRAGNRGA